MDNLDLSPDISAQNYVFKARKKTMEDFDEENKDQIDTTIESLNKILMIKLIVVLKGDDGIVSGARFDAFALFKNTLDVLISAFHMARQRASLEMFSLLRIALEAGCVALHISAQADAFRKYKLGKYKSTAAISFVKKEMPLIGEIWGAISNMSVHINRYGYGPKLKQDKDSNWTPTITLEYNLKQHQPFQDRLLLSFISLVATIILKLEELTLFEKSNLCGGWLRLSASEMKYFSNTDSLLKRYYDEVQVITQAYFSGEK